MTMAEELFLDTAYGRVFAKSVGKASDPLVLGIHGWSQRNGWHTWEPLMAPLAAAGWWVVSVDMPGWGQSTAAQPGPLRTEQAVETVLSLLEQLQPGGTAVLLGKSWGGGVALMLALDDPARIDKLILTAPAFRDFARLPDLQQPVLMAWAEDDPVIPVAYTQQYQAAVPHLQLEIYPTGGHSAAQKNVADFAPKAVKFLQS